MVKNYKIIKEEIPLLERSDYFKYIAKIADYKFLKTKKDILRVFIKDDSTPNSYI